MRRKSDVVSGERTGNGRRARDQVLSGEPPTCMEGDADLQNLSLFVGDDIREAALAVGGIEDYLVQVTDMLRQAEIKSATVKGALEFDGARRLNELEEALGSLHRSLEGLYARTELLERRKSGIEENTIPPNSLAADA